MPFRKLTWAIALAMFAGNAPASASRYEIATITITDLGTLGGQESVARDINNLGDAVGWAHKADGRQSAFMHLAGVMADIGWNLASNYDTEATGINSLRSAVAIARARTDLRPHAATYSYGGSMVLMDEGIHPDVARMCNYRSLVQALNDSGMAVGAISIQTPTSRCYPAYEPAYWTHVFGVPETLDVGLPGGQNFDVNNHGTFVGMANECCVRVDHKAFRWHSGVLTAVPLPPGMGILGSGGPARGINDGGQVVGEFYVLGESGARLRRAFFWDGVGAHSIFTGVLPTGTESMAYEVNRQGFVVGVADKWTISPLPGPPGYRRNHGFVWHPSIGMRELPKLPASGYSGGCEAYAVNDLSQGRVQIVGYCNSGSRRRAVRWDVSVRFLGPS
ncbi:putative HAF family extracellular repeat protein [Povalibacter uvarum]|uniref:Putative HAF family extracellular repeat protein n=1 Tax=Povalibacter uvarum TaxID=732238 RepID=A0A841HTH3_9GAMM|nr:hypothetical protein [Povalibacter uvarum]MBB6096196.1 putative HAF family extracellular repeat protein [Povalibacter uvarum]